MVGKSTVGRSLTGSCRYAIAPNTMMPSMISVVVTGRLMKSAAMIHDVAFVGSPFLIADAAAGDEPQLAVGDDRLARRRARS